MSGFSGLFFTVPRSCDLTIRNVNYNHKQTFKVFYGYPTELISNNGRHFVSEKLENGIKHRKVILYWSRANGLVEVFNKSLKKGNSVSLPYEEKLEN